MFHTIHRIYMPSVIEGVGSLSFENVDTDAQMEGHFTGFTSHLKKDD